MVHTWHTGGQTSGSDKAVTWWMDEVSFEVVPNGSHRPIGDHHVVGRQAKIRAKISNLKSSLIYSFNYINKLKNLNDCAH